eukprot:4585741-Pleurochrysis_carterae.AAC.1
MAVVGVRVLPTAVRLLTSLFESPVVRTSFRIAQRIIGIAKEINEVQGWPTVDDAQEVCEDARK